MNRTTNKLLAACLSGALLVSPAALTACGGQKSEQTTNQVQVPNLVGITRADAEKALANLQFSIGTEQLENSDTVPAGSVISQKPDALSFVEPGATITLTISKGKADPEQVEVPDLSGLTLTEAEDKLAAAKLVAVPGEPVQSSSVAPGKVCQQSVKAGEKVAEGTKVTFSVALGQATVAVPDVAGKTIDAAKSALASAGLAVDTVSAYSDTAAANVVIAQSVAAGTQVVSGSTITLQVSLGVKPATKVQVPNIMTYGLNGAANAIVSAGLKYRYSGDDDGVVVSQDPAAGTQLDAGGVVTFVLQKPTQLCTIPDVAGMTGQAARAAVEQAGLMLDYNVKDPLAVLTGTIPGAGVQIAAGTVIEAVY